MAKSTANIRIYGGDAGGVWVADVGTTAPTGLAAPATGWTELGWLSDTGLELEQKADKKKFYGWQGGTVVAVSISKAERMFTFECLEETAVALGLAYPGVAFTTASSVATGTVPAGITAVHKAFTLDAEDAEGNIKRYRVPNGNVDPNNKTEHKFDGMTVYKFVVDVIGSFDIVTNSPGVLSA